MKRKKISVARPSPRHTREPTRSLGLARRGQLIILDVLRIASWILGTGVPLKKGPTVRGLQTVPHSKTGTRALLGPCASAFRCCALRRRRRSHNRCCYTLSAPCTRSAGALLRNRGRSNLALKRRPPVHTPVREGAWVERIPFGARLVHPCSSRRPGSSFVGP